MKKASKSASDTSSMSNAGKSSKNERKLEIGLVGNTDVGKTCLIRKFVSDESADGLTKHSTIGIEKSTIRIMEGDQQIKVILWDPAGQERYQNLTKSYFNQIDGIMLVFDVCNEDSFEGVLRWFYQVKDVKDCPIVIVGNKSDREDCIITDDDIKEVTDQLEVQCFKTSALTGDQVDETFMTLIQISNQKKIADDKLKEKLFEEEAAANPQNKLPRREKSIQLQNTNEPEKTTKKEQQSKCCK